MEGRVRSDLPDCVRLLAERYGSAEVAMGAMAYALMELGHSMGLEIEVTTKRTVVPEYLVGKEE